MRHAFGVFTAFLLVGFLAGIISLCLHWPSAIPVLAGGSLGGLFVWVWMRRSRHGVESRLIEDHARWLTSEETVLILRAPIETLRVPWAALQESGGIPPTVFILHPDRGRPTGGAQFPGVQSPPVQIRDLARRLATVHEVGPTRPSGVGLLKQLEKTRQWLHQACSDLSEASRMEQRAPPTTEWILDNEFVIESNTRDVQLNLSRRFVRELPKLSTEACQGLPRVYALSEALVSNSDLRLDKENILSFNEAYQSLGTLTIGELWAIPQMLRIALIRNIENLAAGALGELREREIASFWANRLITANRRDPNLIFSILAELAATHPTPSSYLASQLVDHLYDEGAALAPVRSWLERTLQESLSGLNYREQNRQTRDQIAISNAFYSLRQLALLDWRPVFERLSCVEQLLRTDPSGVYPQTDFDTRDQCRRKVEELARRSGRSEAEVAQCAIDLAARAALETANDERRIHVGTYLAGEGRCELAQHIGCHEAPRYRVLDWVRRHHSAVYFQGVLFFCVAIMSPVVLLGLRGQTPGVQFLSALLLLVPSSQLAIEILNYLVTRLLSPRTLPKMDFEESGVPDAFRTLVVVPVLLVDEETILAEVEKLEVRYLANQENNLLFSLFTDYTDSDQLHHEKDASLLQSVAGSLESLNHRYGPGRFFLFHREREWSESERKFIGWERKRGKLEELNCLIDGTRPNEAPPLVCVGDRDQLSNVRFVITLDSDTQLPLGAARRMIETLAHPLNRPRFDAEGGIVAGSFTIIQPRVSPSLPSTSASLFSRLFADAVGIDPYTRAVSDVNQDLTGEGSYYGKGIYDVRAFSRVLSGKFPEAWLLSHDLIEGAYVRVGLASDIELYDEFPQGYLSYTSRQHRWIRGDWQIADWILPSVPLPGGGRGPNPLSWFNRWKVFDNLRRSLVPAASLGLLIAAWLTSTRMGWMAGLLVVVQLLFHPLAQPFTWATTGQALKSFSFAQLAHDLLRAIVEAALLPYQAWLSLDAILRVWYRRLISHRGLLEWTSAQAAHWSAPGKTPMFVISLGLASIFSAIVGLTVQFWRPSILVAAGPWLALWFLSPVIGLVLTLQPPAKRKHFPLPERDLRSLRKVARRTWRYFSDLVNEGTSWLPPDNYQVSPQTQLAMRTSPTNIGLWMLSALGAHDFGYLTTDEVVDRLSLTMETIGELERYEGHLLNWYDIQTLAPLEPRYVSTVDSGNLLGVLWALEHGLEDLMRAPLLSVKAFKGLRDTGEILKEIVERKGGSDSNLGILDELMRGWEAPPDRIVDALRLLRQAEAGATALAPVASDSSLALTDADYWASQMRQQIESWLTVADRYLAWIEILGEKTEEEVDPDLVQAFREGLHQAPSLFDLAQGNMSIIQSLQSFRDNAPSADGPLFEWIERLLQAFAKSKWLAGEMLAKGGKLIRRNRELSESMNMRFLYDAERRLFLIGYSVSEGRLDSAYYDLLASEARLGSFVAIARGDISFEHWFSMSRPYGAIGRRRVLLSWTGTMFEYLMPLILQRSYGNSLLDKAAEEAVAVQIAYGRKHRVPWGISESAFGDLDINKTYQYRAFGVPELGLKRGLEEKVVIAPYATLLAVNVAPKETVRNLERLTGLGLLGGYGYFESMDFSRQPSREGERGVIIRTYMAHHQGMGFLSLANFFFDNVMQHRFHADARVRTVEPLLQERIPALPPLHHISTRERVSSVTSFGEVAPSVSEFDTPHTATPRTQLLSNGRYGLMVTNAGGGYSQWGGHEITRWRSDRTQDQWGSFCYIHEAETGRLWSTTYHPTGGIEEEYSVNFALDHALFRRVDNGIQTDTEIIVSPEDDVEIRRVTLINRSGRTRRLNLTSYIELSMAPHNADRQHPAFNKLFIQTEAVPDHRALLASRRPRGKDDPPIFVAHRLTMDQGEPEVFRFETDRRRFVGRGRTLANPMGAFQDLGNSQGFVLDPILSLRESVNLLPGQRLQVSSVLAAGETRERVLALMDKYREPYAIDRAMDFTWASAQLELQLLHIQPSEARRFQQMAGHLLFPNPQVRPPTDRIEGNRKGQAGLWPYGISGDLPIVLVTIGEPRDIDLVRQVLQAHTYWRMHGLIADLLILNEEKGGYERPLRERLALLIQSHSMSTGINRPGGIYLRGAEVIPEDDLMLLRAAANIVLVAARGGLPQQSGVPIEVAALPEPLAKKRAPRDPSAPLPFMELSYFNSLGGFTPDGREYAVYLGPNTHTPAPWVNVIANPTFGTLVSETGSGFTWYGNSQRNRLTQWSNDPVLDPPSEAIYIRDEESGLYWTPTASPIRQETAYRARHGAGYSVFEHNIHGIEQELTVFVPVDENGGEPVKLQKLRLRNDSSRRRMLSVTYYAEWTLGENRESTQMHVATYWDADVRALIARNRFHPEYGDRVAFAGISPLPESYTGDRTAFIGRNRSLANPAAMGRTRLSRRTGAGFDPCAGLRVMIELAPGESAEITTLLGQAESVEKARGLVLAYRDSAAFDAALSQTKAWWDDRLGVIEVHTPELAADFLINRWLLYQSLSCRIWGRSGFYQSGGAFGFRDQLQDVMALVYSCPEVAREHILLAASRQFKEGDVQHWWHPPSGAGIRSRISDDSLWLPHVVARYIQVTGDVDILHTKVPFLDAPVLESGQHESFTTPEVGLERSTMFEHCQRAVTRGMAFGARGLPLMGTGDWNDGMNLVGAEGKGESVWLAWFLTDVLQGMAVLSDLMDQPELGEAYRQDRSELLQRVERVAWDGEWYLRATFDDGSPLGSSANAEAKIDSLPQSWAWLCGGAAKDRAEKALDSAWNHLVREDEGLVLLFTPPFDKMVPSPGYIKGYPPGVRENGGQYTHAALWFAMALARRGDGTRAVNMLRMLNPIEHAREPEAVWRYGIEPYAVAGDVYRLPGRIGHGGWSWYTGSAAWMYRAWVEEVLGLKVLGENLHMDPVIPGHWEGFHLRYRHGEAIYEIQVENPERRERGVLWVEVDGKRGADAAIPLERGLIKHRILVRMGQKEQSA
jgi:cyclic beta-1,2-glucan synthetase